MALVQRREEVDGLQERVGFIITQSRLTNKEVAELIGTHPNRVGDIFNKTTFIFKQDEIRQIAEACAGRWYLHGFGADELEAYMMKGGAFTMPDPSLAPSGGGGHLLLGDTSDGILYCRLRAS